MSKLKALFIDPYRKEVRHIEVDNDIAVWHALLDCNCFDVRRIAKASWGTTLDLWFDGEFLLKDSPDPVFRLPLDGMSEPLVIGGYGLMTGGDGHGETISLGDGFNQPSEVIQRNMKIQFETWERRLKPIEIVSQIMRTPETEPKLCGHFRYLDTIPVSGNVTR